MKAFRAVRNLGGRATSVAPLGLPLRAGGMPGFRSLRRFDRASSSTRKCNFGALPCRIFEATLSADCSGSHGCCKIPRWVISGCSGPTDLSLFGCGSNSHNCFPYLRYGFCTGSSSISGNRSISQLHSGRHRRRVGTV
jgi:hypothetical protein